MRPVASGVTDRRQERRNGRKDERRYDYHGDGFRRIRGFLCVGRNKDKCKELSACEDVYKRQEEGLDELSPFADLGARTITASETEDKDWINNWKQYFKPFTVDDIRCV